MVTHVPIPFDHFGGHRILPEHFEKAIAGEWVFTDLDLPFHLLVAEFKQCQDLRSERGPMTEIIFEVREDEIDGGYTASALGYGIHTQEETLEELRAMVRDAVRCSFDDAALSPKMIRLHFAGDEVLAMLNL